MDQHQVQALEAVQNTAVSLTTLSHLVTQLQQLSGQLATLLLELERVVMAESQVLMEQSSLTQVRVEVQSTVAYPETDQ
jgi:hypothetical protein